jgi:hypothetical protein
VSGHDFSRAVPTRLMRALAPEVLLSCPVQTFSASLFLDPKRSPEIKSFQCLLAEGWIPVEYRSFALPDRFDAR